MGRTKEAYALETDALQRLSEGPGEDDETYLNCARGPGEDLRAVGQYDDAYEHDRPLVAKYYAVFGFDRGLSLQLRNNFALDLRCTGRYAEALELDTYVMEQRLRQ